MLGIRLGILDIDAVVLLDTRTSTCILLWGPYTVPWSAAVVKYEYSYGIFFFFCLFCFCTFTTICPIYII